MKQSQSNEVKPLKEKTSVGCISHSFHVPVGFQSQNNFKELTWSFCIFSLNSTMLEGEVQLTLIQIQRIFC